MERDSLQCVALAESVSADRCHVFRYVNFFQRQAVLERIFADCLDRLRDYQRTQLSAMIKSITADARHTVGNFNGFDTLILTERAGTDRCDGQSLIGRRNHECFRFAGIGFEHCGFAVRCELEAVAGCSGIGSRSGCCRCDGGFRGCCDSLRRGHGFRCGHRFCCCDGLCSCHGCRGDRFCRCCNGFRSCHGCGCLRLQGDSGIRCGFCGQLCFSSQTGQRFLQKPLIRHDCTGKQHQRAHQAAAEPFAGVADRMPVCLHVHPPLMMLIKMSE